MSEDQHSFQASVHNSLLSSTDFILKIRFSCSETVQLTVCLFSLLNNF